MILFLQSRSNPDSYQRITSAFMRAVSHSFLSLWLILLISLFQLLGLPYFVFLAFFLVSIVVSMLNLHRSNVDRMVYLSSQFARDPMAMPMEWGRQIPILPVFICTVPLVAGTASLVAPCLKLWVRLVSPILTFLIGDLDSCQSASSRLQCPPYAFCSKVLTCPLDYIFNFVTHEHF